jgi:hypothetical protein
MAGMEVMLRIQSSLHIHSKPQWNFPKVFIISKNSLRIGETVSSRSTSQGTRECILTK